MNAPTQSKAIAASRFGYPFKDKQDRDITDPQALYEGLAFVQGGHYLLGAHGFFHGGIHFDRSCSNAFSLDRGIRCLADGEVVAYRINREYLDATRGTAGDGPTLRPYSTGFVLVRHRLQAPTPPQPDKPAPMDHPMADARNMGTYLYSDPEGRQRARWLRHGTPLTMEIGKYAPGQRYLRVLGIGGPGSPATGWISPTWLALDPAAGTSLFNVLGFKDQVSTYVRGGDHPDPERMAAYSQSQAERARPAPAPAPTLTLYSLYMHLADFADYRAQSKWQRPGWWSAAQYRVGDKAKDQQAAASVHAKVSRSVGLNIREEPSGKSVILGLLPRGTCIETGERSPNGKWARISKVVAGEIDSPVAGGHVPVGALNGWVYLGELMADTRPEAFDSVVVLDKPFPIRQGDVLGYLGEDVPSRANPIANQPVSRRLLHLEVFSGDDMPAYLAASRQWAATTWTDKERTLLLLRPGDTLHVEPNGAVACTLNWAQVLPLSTLESKEVDGQRWRKVKGLMLDNGRMGEGWAKEAGHLASPWEWPGFDVVDEHASSAGGVFEDLAAWAGFIKKEGPRPEETPFYKQLRRMLDTNHDGLVSEQELDAALRDRSKAAHMARIIVRHDSAWAKEPAVRQRNVMARIADLLGPGAVEQVEAEAPRAGKLPWWDEVAGGVDGFPNGPRVYHFHPGGVAGNYIAPALDDLKVSRGQVTFDAEGNDAPGSAYFSRRLHWPGGASGVTLGRGYDMKHRTQEAVHVDLVSAGVDESSARDFAQGAGLAGQAAQRFVSTHREEFGEISRTAQRILFESIVYPRYEEAAQRQYREATHENANLMAWEQLDVRVRDIAVDLTYQQGSIWKRQLPYIVGNDREALAHYIESTQELARYEPGRRRARYLRR